MAKRKKSENIIVKILTYVLFVLLVLGIAGIISLLVLRSNGVTFTVMHCTKIYYSDDEQQSLGELEPGEEKFVMLDISGAGGYEVSITSNPEADFSFTVNGVSYHFYDEDNAAQNDYSDFFCLEKTSTGFMFTVPESNYITEIIGAVYGGEAEIDTDLPDTDLFLLTVSAGDSVLQLSFSTYTEPRMDISHTHIVF